MTSSTARRTSDLPIAEPSHVNRLCDSNVATSHDETSTAATATPTPSTASTDRRWSRRTTPLLQPPSIRPATPKIDGQPEDEHERHRGPHRPGEWMDEPIAPASSDAESRPSRNPPNVSTCTSAPSRSPCTAARDHHHDQHDVDPVHWGRG